MNRLIFGDLPATWVQVRLQNVCQINPRLLSGDRLDPDALITFVPMAAVDEFDGKITQPEERTFAEVKRGFTPFRNGDVLFAKITPSMENGKAAIAENLINGIGFGSTEFHVLRPGPLILAEWIFALIRQPIFRIAAKASFVGTAGQQRVPAKFLENFEIPLPTLLEQRRIVAILRKADELRQLRRQANARVQQLLPALFDEMFGDPISNPKAWPVFKLSDLGELDRGKSRHRPRDAAFLYGGPYPFIQTGDITNANGWISTYSQTYSEAGLAQSRLWSKGTLCITIAANIAQTGILTFDACFPDSVVGFLPGPNITSEYVQYWLRRIQQQLEANAPQSAQKNINLAILRNLDIPCPPYELQRQFQKATYEIHNQYPMQDRVNTLINELFESILARAFTGNITAAWREAHVTELAEATAERDRLLNKPIPLEAKPLVIAPPDLGAPTLTVKPSRAIYADLDTATQSLLAAAQARPAYFRPADLLNGTDLTAVQAEAGLHLLAALGFVRQVGLEGQLVYRRVDPIAESAAKPEFLP